MTTLPSSRAAMPAGAPSAVVARRAPAPRALLLAAASALLLGGCASFTPDAGLGEARATLRNELGKDVVKITTAEEALTVEARARDLLKRPLTPDAAVQVALLNNRGLQASFADLGVAEAAYVAATLPAAPRVSLSRLAGGLQVEVERALAVSLLDLATLPARAGAASRTFEAARWRAALAALKLAAEARRQYYRTLAANQTVGFLQQALGTAEAASTLVRQLGETGAINKLEQAREHAFYTELGAQLAKARLVQRAERERLVRHLGLLGPEAAALRLPAALPPLPAKLESGAAIEARAIEKRVDIKAARAEIDALSGRYGLAAATRFVGAVELSARSTTDTSRSFTNEPSLVNGELVETPTARKDSVTRRGLGIDVQVPLYDFGGTAVRGAQEAYLAAVHRLAETAVNARSEAREAYFRYRGNHDLARHYRGVVLPLRRTIQDQALLQYSGMLIDVSALIQDARARILSNIQAIEAQREFWIASTDLKAAVIGGGVGAGAPAEGPTPVGSATPE